MLKLEKISKNISKKILKQQWLDGDILHFSINPEYLIEKFDYDDNIVFHKGDIKVLFYVNIKTYKISVNVNCIRLEEAVKIWETYKNRIDQELALFQNRGRRISNT